jgi:site-specific DNA recombinase
VTPMKTVRCAIYTRKSSEEGLEQSFNSLDAQREACEAYILSQRHEGWKVLPTKYDDGGFSGGNIERPSLIKLLEDVSAKRIDTVVVYKVDRLTRSLADFAKIVERFDERGVSFVSVTQQFNTTTSMGRLTLNVLLSFAQFEREVTGERIRDKIAASKRKGMWMGGVVPLGYDAIDRRLIINPKEAERVRQIYSLYLKLGCVSKLRRHLDQAGMRSKAWVSRSGTQRGGCTFSRGALYELLQNRLYLGEVSHKGAIYAGQHEAIIDRKLWERVQQQFKENQQAPRKRSGAGKRGLLTGLLYDEIGNRFVPTHSSKRGKRYHYYTSQTVIHGKSGNPDGPTRLPADEIEQLVTAKLQTIFGSPIEMQRILCAPNASPREIKHTLDQAAKSAPATSTLARRVVPMVIRRVVVRHNSVDLELSRAAVYELVLGKACNDSLGDQDTIRIELRAVLQRCGGGQRLVLPADGGQAPRVEPPLVRAIARAHDWLGRILSGEVGLQKILAAETGLDRRYIGNVIRLAFLAPDITEAILDGRQPPALNLQRLPSKLPLCWTVQREAFAPCK